MKIRKGFVSNSSSSSFVCEVCGEIEGGMDISLYDVEMASCANDHVFCVSHAVNTNEKCIIDENGCSFEYANFDHAYNDLGGYNIPILYCPICQMHEVSIDDRNEYILKKYNITEDEIDVQIKNQFKTYTELKTYLTR